MTDQRRAFAVAAPLLVGVALLAYTIARMEPIGSVRAFALILPAALLPSAGWHLLRTVAWRQCFPGGGQPSFARLFRVRLAAEAFSFVTIRGVAGEPLKVLLLERDIAPAVSASAVALERVAYLLITTLIVGVAAATAAAALPLSPTWSNIFVGVATVALLAVAVIVALLIRRASSRPREQRERPASALARFMRQLDAQLRDLIHADRRRLASLVILETLAYAMMALEVWAVLRFTPSPITLGGAMAVETFTRVASMVSAFIPGNLGALEASNVAAAAALHAAGGAAALALARRLRGIAWAAAGFVVYPRRLRTDRGDRTLVVVERASPSISISERLCGMPIGERIVRAAARSGFGRVLVWTPLQHAAWSAIRVPPEVEVVVEHDEESWRSRLGTLDPLAAVTVVAPGVVPLPPLLMEREGFTPMEREGFSRANGTFQSLPSRLAEPADLAAALARVRPDEEVAAPGEAKGGTLRSLKVSTRAELEVAERRLRRSIFKTTDGNLGEFNRRISIPISVALIRWTRFSANAMSGFIIFLGLYAGWLFSRGDYVNGVLGAIVSWGSSVLDGCDGELARLQYSDSAFGCWLDTLGDYLYYIAIFVGLTIGTVRGTGWQGFGWIGGALLAGMLLTFALLILLRNRTTRGRPERLRTTTKTHFYRTGKRWARVVARLSNVATRATMPYGILGFAVLGLLPVVLVLGAIGAQIYWISLAVELRRLLSRSADRLAYHHPSCAVGETCSRQPSV